ncbi:hypothetical protein [Paenibacillus sp. OV219]|uniref:hypothetical protein n=1 Tax=Paenibacillus sp. OV219 TaxID=1884377 RepID=UPI0008D038A0|nr:hypothetical protein [Paenibacillus sp. OV219]SEN24168.1 hypothetical protein SAMN05518847_102496 [Paenibacillus sp. OV219]
MDDRSQKHYEAAFDNMTKVLIMIIIVLLAAILLSQLALQIPAVRLWVTGVDRLEGTPF